MSRLKIQRVRIVPPIPMTIIVIPNVQLSMLKYLLLILGVQWIPPLLRVIKTRLCLKRVEEVSRME
jgi:hypothetical protein